MVDPEAFSCAGTHGMGGGGPKATSMAGLSKKALIELACISLGSVFRHRRGTIAQLIESIHVHDWASDPSSFGAYSYECIGGAQARKDLARPVEKTLFFAGEATDTGGQASTVAGAIASGQRAANEVLDSLRRE